MLKSISVICSAQPLAHRDDSFFPRRIWGTLLASELTEDSSTEKVIGSLIFHEAGSTEEVRKIVQGDKHRSETRTSIPQVIPTHLVKQEKVVIQPHVLTVHWLST